MKPSMTATFLDLGDATSRNLEFSHGADVWVSYGEETVTEMNLLEIRRRHADRIHLRTFSKPMEAKTGADWEWHIVGRQRTLKMRVQAKRVQRNGILKIKHKVASSGTEQRKLLIDGAQADKMKPVYCIYCTEPQRRIWQQAAPLESFESYQSGCLLADAADVQLTTKKLQEIEKRCVPWHYLFERNFFAHEKRTIASRLALINRGFESVIEFLPPIPLDDREDIPDGGTRWNAPTINDLNADTGREFDRIGVEKTTDEDRARLRPATSAGQRVARLDRDRFCDRGIGRLIVMDVGDEGSG